MVFPALRRAFPGRGRDRAVRPQLVQSRGRREGDGLLHAGGNGGVPEGGAGVRAAVHRRRHPPVQILAVLRPGSAGGALREPAQEPDEALEAVADRYQGARPLRRLHGRQGAHAGEDAYRLRPVDPDRLQRPAGRTAHAAARPARPDPGHGASARRDPLAAAAARAFERAIYGARPDRVLCSGGEARPRAQEARSLSSTSRGERMRATRLLAKLTIYYALIGIAVFAAIRLWPAAQGWLPVGGVEQLIAQPAKNPLQASEAVRAAHVNNLGQSLFWLAVALISALLLSLPVSWVYMGIRNDEEYDQSLINTIIVLPMVVTGIVIIVQNSLALAFSLAGIAGAVRFRNSLKSSGDALFILLAVAIGLSAGIGAVELAAVVTIAFNYCMLALWMTEFGERKGMKGYLADFDPTTCPPDPVPETVAVA